MKFFEFCQNNSGGYWDKGFPGSVIIEAQDHLHANKLAEAKGIYFNGCEIERDCSCCGDRWSEVWERDGYDVPSHYREPLDEDDKGIVVYYINGEVKKYE